MDHASNNSFQKRISKYFRKQTGLVLGRILGLAFLFTLLAAASHAQSGNLYEIRTNVRLGTLTAYPSLWRIDQGNGGEIKIFSCKEISATGLGCDFTQFKNGRVIFSGDAQIYRSGAVNLRWVYEFTRNQQRKINGGWKYYQVR